MHSSLLRPFGFARVIGRHGVSQAGPSGSKPIDQHTIGKGIINRDRKFSEEKPDWLKHKEALRRNFPDGWNPPKKISRPSMTLLRTLHKTDPVQFSLPVLSHKFKISPEAVRRILRSKWEPDQATSKKTQARDQEVASNVRSSDGWVHHERLETDRIPLNLAQTLQSSLQYSPSQPSLPRDQLQTSSRFTQSKSDVGIMNDNRSDRPQSENNSSPSDNRKLGSAFQASRITFKSGRHR